MKLVNTKQILVLALGLLNTYVLMAQEVLEWRGANRTGYYHETGLLQSWPEAGPELIWEFTGLGNGYGSPAITNDRIYLNGEQEQVTWLFALDKNGTLIWKTEIGPEWTQNYPGSRTTPTVVDDLIYLQTGMGTIACVKASNGEKVWELNMIGDFHAPNTRFGFSESLLVFGDKVFCTIGNADTNVVALNRFSGKIAWICKGVGEMTSFCSPKLISLPGRDIVVTFTKLCLLGIDAANGTLLWTHRQDSEGDVQVNTP